MNDSWPVLSAAQHRRLDQLACELAGLGPEVLMENASSAAARSILRDYPGLGRARVLVGPGNNGGDGLGVARWLSLAGWDVEWVAFPGERAAVPEVAAMRKALELCAVRCVPFEARWEGGGLLVDAWLGTGFQGPLRGLLAQWIPECDRREDLRAARWVALDLPSGLECDQEGGAGPHVAVERTYTFAARKPVLEAASLSRSVGRVEVLELGIPRAVYRAVLGG